MTLAVRRVDAGEKVAARIVETTGNQATSSPNPPGTGKHAYVNVQHGYTAGELGGLECFPFR